MDPEFLVIGHVTKDLDRVGGYVIGGTATYSSLTAQRLGRQAAVVTSASADLGIAARLPGVQFATKLAPESTTFENIYHGEYRHQVVRGVARPTRRIRGTRLPEGSLLELLQYHLRRFTPRS